MFIERRSTRSAVGEGRLLTGGMVRGVIALMMLVPVILELGWHARPFGIPDGLLHGVLVVLWVAHLGVMWWSAAMWRGGGGGWRGFVAHHRVETFVMGLGLVMAWSFGALSWCVAVLVVLTILRGHAWLVGRGVSPSVLFLMSFVLLIGSGTGLLMLPAATPPEKRIGVIDALFTSTSAVCVTGLSVRDTGTEFTRFGQTVILTLIQSGGLGIILFGALLLLAFGGAVDLRSSREITGGATGLTGGMSAGDYLKRVVGIVFGVELAGAALLYFFWPVSWVGAPADLGEAGGRVFHCVFTSVSALCNAGFSTTANSLQGLRLHWTTHVVIALLITAGGIGMPVIINLWGTARARVLRGRGAMGADGKLIRLTLHTKIVLVTTLVVYLVGGFGILMSRLSWGGESFGAALLDAHFMSVTTRTAGFDTVAPNQMGILSRFVMMVQMFIGGSPASTAGGVKTVAVAAIGLTVWNTIRGRAETNAFGRALTDEMVRRAAVLIVLGLVTVASLATVLTVTDPRGLESEAGQAEAFEEILFESVSACGTVGLTMGLTPELSDEGKVAVSIGMFMGRVGPLAFLMALAGVTSRTPDSARYAREDVVMG